MAQPLISECKICDHFKRNVSSLIIEALLILRNKSGLVESEKPINRALRLSFRAANRKLGLEYFPSLDAENSTYDIEVEGGHPDLSWSFHNDLADDDEDC